MRSEEAYSVLPSSLRVDRETLRAQYRAFVGSHCRDFFDALPNMILALNVNRQIVFANRAALDFFEVPDIDSALGMRPGEAVGCVNADITPEGCGTSRHCRNCAALSAIMSAVDGVSDSRKSSMLRRSKTQLEGLDLQVDVSPIEVEGKAYVVFAVTDITHETRRRSMEQIFFHDVLNLAGGIRGLTEILKDSVPDTCSSEMGVLHSAMESLVDEILAQRELSAAESGDLVLELKALNSVKFLHGLAQVYANLPTARGRTLFVSQESEVVDFVSDGRLLKRVVGNMIKNALEAEREGATITLSCRREGDSLCFSVHNPSTISAKIQDDIFHRTVSTKGKTRGLGAYSMMLLAERYLGGSVGFTSSPEEGTLFHIRLPREVLPLKPTAQSRVS